MALIEREIDCEKNPGILAALGLVTCSGLVLAEVEGDAERGSAAAGVCTACHQADGSGKNVPGGESWPRLAGLDAACIAKQLHDYQSGERSNIQAVAAWLPARNLWPTKRIPP